MSISLHRRFVRSFALSLFFGGLVCGVAGAQATPVSALDKQLARIDFSISGVGSFNKSSSGTTDRGQALTDSPGNTLGALAQLRYTVKPYVGFEFNYGFAKFNQNYSTIGGVQATANEFTLGYVAHVPHSILGATPFLSAGAGTTEYKPTPGGGQGLNPQARATYYYSGGLDYQAFGPHFGVRAQFRETFSLAPDFGQNYLTIKQRTNSYQPGIGVYVKF